MSELADSIRIHGVIEPIIARKSGDGYEIVAGERRWRAAKKAGIHKVPAIVKELDDENALVQALTENIHRKGLASSERENAVHTLWETGKWPNQEALAKHLGKSQGWVSQQLSAYELRQAMIPLDEAKAMEMSTQRVLELKPQWPEVKANIRSKADWERSQALIKEQREINGKLLAETEEIHLDRMTGTIIRRLPKARLQDIDICPTCNGRGWIKKPKIDGSEGVSFHVDS